MNHENKIDWQSFDILDLEGGFQIRLHLKVGFCFLSSYIKVGLKVGFKGGF